MILDLPTILFWLIAPLTGLCAVTVVLTQNIVRAAAWLLFTLAGVSAIFFLLGADFVGATQLIVYVGGTLVLVVFGVMLTAQGPFITMKTGTADWAIGVLVGLLFLGVLTVSIAGTAWPTPPQMPSPSLDLTFSDETKAPTMPRAADPAHSMSSIALGEAFLGVDKATPEARLTGLPKGVEAPQRTQMSYLLPFEIVSVHLLVVLLGAAYLARAKRRRGAVS